MRASFTLFKQDSGFTMVELLITMTIFVLTIAAATSVFVPLLTQFKQQSKIAETQIEGIVGLDTLRRDIEHAGFGLPWEVPTAITYSEAESELASRYNDAASNPPRAIVSESNVSFTNIVSGSDYLVIKATNVALNDAATKWSDVAAVAGGTRKVRHWGAPVEDLNTNDRTIVIIPSRGESNQRIIVNNGASFTADFNRAAFPAEYSPGIPGDVYLIYGVDTPGAALRMPFNRADYFIRTGNAPARCATGTGVLMKAVVRQADGNLDEMPLLDCVADMQVVFFRDTDNDGTIDDFADDIRALKLTPKQIRDTVKEVRVYILAHEGQRDSTYTYPNNTITVGAPGCSRDFPLSATIGTGWQNYRWKIYTLAVRPRNMG